MKKILFCLILGILIFSDTIVFAASKPSVVADGALLIDMNSGQILFEKNKDVIYHPASTTKIMTALLTLEKCKLDDKIIVGKNPPFVDGSKIYIYEGEEFTVDQLLHALLIESANDVAEALAEHISGSVSEFAKLMNERAKELGCKNTNFVNPHGLFDQNHYTTAYDLSLIAREAMKNPVFRDIVNDTSYTMEPTNKQPEKRYFHSSNRIITDKRYRIDGANGIKTGYTVQSGHSFVGSVSKDGMDLMVVLLHDKKPGLWEDASSLLKYGLSSYKTIKKISSGDIMTTIKPIGSDVEIPLTAEKDFYYTVPIGDNPEVSLNFIINENKGNIVKGQNMGYAEYSINGNSIGTVNLLASHDYEPKVLDNLTASIKSAPVVKFNKSYWFILIIGFLITGTFAWLNIIKIRKRKIRSKRF